MSNNEHLRTSEPYKRLILSWFLVKASPIDKKFHNLVLFVPGILATLVALAVSGNDSTPFTINLLFFLFFFYGTVLLAGTALMGWAMTFVGLSIGLIVGLFVSEILPGYSDISANLAAGVVLGALGGAGLSRIGQTRAARLTDIHQNG